MTPRDIILDLLARDAAPCDTQCGMLTQLQRDALLHVVNGGPIDVPVGTGREPLAGDSGAVVAHVSGCRVNDPN